MGNKNDRWSALSMKERADLIKLYVSNGITSLDTIKKDYNSFKEGGNTNRFETGGPIETDEFGYPADITPAIVTQDSEFNKFLMTLPDNQRFTPEEDYHTYQYWKINGRPKDFSEALNLGMYHYDSSDNSYHANSVAFDSKGVGHFMKPKHHPTVKYELDWYNKGIGTLEGGKQYPLQGEERKEWEDFRSQYQLDSTGVNYKYVPRKHHNSFGDGGPTREMTPSEAAALNKTLNNSQYMLAVGDSPDDPAYLSTDYLEPAVVKAFNSEEEYNRYQGEKFGEYVSNEISEAGTKLAPVLVGAAAAPWAISGGIAAYSNPLIKTGLDIIGSIDGVRNAASNNGIRKTIRLAKEGDVWGATKSAVGDILDITGGIGLADDVYRYSKGASKRLAETVLRIGPLAAQIGPLKTQILNKKALNYIFNPYADPKLVYDLPYMYSGNAANVTGYVKGYEGDVIDKFLRKVPVSSNMSSSEVPEAMMDYIQKNYPGKKIEYIDLGEVISPTIIPEYTKGLKVGERVRAPGEHSQGFVVSADPALFGTKFENLLDPGGYNQYYRREGNDLISEGFDIWKFNPDNYMNRYKLFKDSEEFKTLPISKRVKYALTQKMLHKGLSFIDNQGIPLVHKWHTTFEDVYKNGGKLNIFDTGGPIQTALETDLKGSSYFENVLNSIAQTSDQEALKDATEVDHRLNIRFKVPNDTPEAIYVSKVNNLVKEKSKEEIIKDLKSKSEDEVKEIQKQLGDEGYYDFELSTGKSNNASTVQKQLVKEGYLTNKDVDSNIGNITTTALQTMLVDKGYLPRYTQDGKDNIDGLLGKRTREAYKQYNRDFNIDGKLGNKTINSFLKSKEKEVKGFDTYVSAEGMVDQCAKWVATKYDTVTGAGKQNGVHGNAWNMLTNIEDAGGKMLFNIYDDAVFDNVSTPSQVKQATQQALKNYNIDYSKLIKGDVVGIYIPSSTHYSDVLKSGTTYNTHVGIIVDVEDGIPIVEHNILGRVRRERIDNLSGSVYGKPTVTVASRPKTGEQVRQLEFKDIKSKYILPEGKENSLMREYMDSLASAKETFKHVFDNVDLDFIEEAAIAITKRETDFMTNKPSDNRFKPSFIATKIVHQLKNTPQDIVSQDLTKMKFNSLNSTYRASIGLSSPEQLSNDPTITGRAVMLLLSKNYDYFTRLAKQNPELGLTKEDIENATILSYNRGIGATHTLGFNKDGSLNIEELKYLRESSKLDAKEKDISSTKLKHLKLLGEKAGQLAEWYYDRYGDPHTPYVSRARQTMLTLRKK